jgi:hypothetical protein
MGVSRRRCRQLPDLVENELNQMTSRFNNTGGAYGTPHCASLRLVLVGGMGSIGDNLYRLPWGFVSSAPLPDPADAVVYACFNRP